MRSASIIILVIGAALVAASAPPAAADGDITTDKAIGLFMAPCCFNGTLADHHSSEAVDMKEEIAGMVERGTSAAEIKAEFVARYGERILAEPVAEGINRLAVIMPVLVVLIGGIVTAAAIRRMRSDRNGGAASPEPPHADTEDDEIEAMIREDS